MDGRDPAGTGAVTHGKKAKAGAAATAGMAGAAVADAFITAVELTVATRRAAALAVEQAVAC